VVSSHALGSLDETIHDVADVNVKLSRPLDAIACSVEEILEFSWQRILQTRW
jgi:hypothetical protein